jgi:uncharacterized phage protein gp47/JayE
MSYSDDNSFEKIMNRMLANERLNNVDKRVGSIAYDSIAPCAMELAEVYVKLDILEEQTYLLSATGLNLDKKVYDYGVVRNEATVAQRIGKFQKYKTDENGEFILDSNGDKILVDMEIPIDSRFVVPEDSETTFIYIGKIDGNDVLECEQTGTKGNQHIGIILPLTPIKDMITSEIISTYKFGEDKETDTDLRNRTLEIINTEAFGGNISDYIEKTNSIDGVGNTKVFPAWQFNGSVLLSIVDPQFNPVTEEFIKNIKEQLDPEENTGQGVGIAPIGHYVTVTTPVKNEVSVSLSVELEAEVTISQVQEQIETEINKYFESVRKEFGQNKILAIYRARVIDSVLNVKEVLNVTNVLLNNLDEDVVLNDTETLDGQHLPYLKEVKIV